LYQEEVGFDHLFFDDPYCGATKMALDFSLSEEHELVRNSVLEVLKQFEPRRAEFKKMVVQDKIFPQEIWDALSEAGFMGCLIPEQYGGTDMGLLSLTIAMETMSSVGFGSGMLVLTSMDASCILKNGTEELKQRFLPGIASGELKFCFALTEPNAGSNTFRLETTAEKDGDSYIINGQKCFITGVDNSDYMLLVVRTTTLEHCEATKMPKAYGLSLFIVDPKTPGCNVRPLPMRGIEGHGQFELFFENCRVPAENLVGQENAGTMALFNSLNPERILAAATACGITEYMLKRSVDYAKERRVFKDRPIGAYQAIQHPLAHIKIELEATRLLNYKAAWCFDQGMPPGQIGMWANMAKYKAAELAIDAVDRAIQTHGGFGFTEEYGIIFYWESVRLLRTAPVSKEMILNYVAEHSLGLPRSY
jgi:alkylation response protein AidB-like acyl-CoA dehydrogenase